ncbi:RHS repeat domain-containing protein [Xenorhabdus kozodoii]|uniref:RHS family protein n=1 Tax=Xenorhabdus kozodoii TaxID=351676 RepID=A0A2D0LEN1_9GAMM|nr:RHS repeat-associated core domain-containing protein [Xenorhabdus kozodoii]PHM74164.1 RHS family protein [Xenorhabdus kozodoii]
MQNDFFSHAHNFQSAALGSVDPRTGLFTYTLLVAQLAGSHHLGPAQTLALAYSPLNTANRGFGRGFSLGLTQYDSQQRLLSLSTGERYKVDEYADRVYLKQYKQDGVRFEKDVAQNVYRVIHKSGTVEVLTGPDNAYRLKVPTQILTPLGHFLTLDWAAEFGGALHLTTLTDDTGKVLLTVHYERGSYTRFIVWPDTTETYAIRLLFENDAVTRVEKDPDTDHTLAWSLGYDIDNRFLTQITAPTGLSEQVIYDSNGHRFPAGAPLSALPYVTRHTQSPGHGPDIVRTYQYTVANFLGYGEKGHWQPDEDFLYGVLSDYQYGSTEHWDNGTTQRHITRRYNKYHLLVSETTEQNGCTRAHVTDYYAQVGRAFDDQPPQFQLPKTASMSFNDTVVEVIQTEFDAAGNPTRQVAPDGTRTDWVYYPAAGEAGGCPASPHGFVRFVKSKTVTPGQPTPADGYTDAPIHQVVYRYEALPTLPGAPAPHAVVCTYQGRYSAGRLLHESRPHYTNDTHSPDHGRIYRVEETVYALDGAGTWQSHQTFRYTLAGEALVKHTEWTGHDQLSLTSQRRQSQVSGKLWHETDAQHCTARYDYDAFGRIAAQTHNADTDYSQSEHYDYAIEGAGAITTTKTDVWGNQARLRLNGLGHPCQKEICRQGEPEWQLLSDTGRDGWGRIVSQTQYDWLPVEHDPDPATRQLTRVATRQRLEYDDWGKLHRIIRGTGETLLYDYDPVNRTEQITRQAGGVNFSRCTVAYDLRHQPVTVTRYDSQSRQYSQQHSDYDGGGRLRATVDVLGQKTEYGYDVLGRLSTITHADGTVIRKTYAPFTTSSLVTQIAVDGQVVGSRCFDSLHRLVSVSSGGRTYHLAYQGTAPYPSQITDPRGQTVQYDHEPRLGNALLRVVAGDLRQHFAYDSKTGKLAEARADGQATRTLGYTAAGRLQQETCRFDDAGAGAARSAHYTYSPAGRLTAYQDVTGKTTRISFDGDGRPVAARDPDLDIVLTYDAASRVQCWRVVDKQGKRLTTARDFDDFGRETRREIQTENDTLVLALTYTVNNQIASRTLHSRQAGLLCEETYAYDPARHWLTEYTCTGAERPRDAYGVSLSRQHFTYDRLGNILACLTTLADGSQDTATFSYSSADPCQLQRITHSHPDYPATLTLLYDAAGRLVQDEAGRQLTYNALGRLASVHLGDTHSAYSYDAANRLVLQQLGNDCNRELYYQGASRVTEIQRESGQATRLLRAQGETVAALTGDGRYLLGTDNQGSVRVSQAETGAETRYRYAPYGQQAEAESNPDLPAYQGERLDAVGGVYHLGNGYRTYNPVLMRFTAPDSQSPFGAGGLNPYAYCLGDPINRSDPTGHFSLGGLLGIIGGAIGLVIGLALAIPTGGASLAGDAAILAGLVADITGIISGALEDSNPRVSAILGWVSMGMGALTLGAGALGGLARGGRQLSRPAVLEGFSEGFTSGEPRRMNLASPPPEVTAPPDTGSGFRGSSSDYVIAFRRAMDEGRISRVENPVGGGTYTVGLETQGILPAGGEVQYLRSALFRSRGDGSTIEIIDNIVPLSDGTQQPINIGNEDLEMLYLHFIHTSILSNQENDSIITSINNIRFYLSSHMSRGVELSAETISRIQSTWINAAFSNFNANEWLYTTLRFLSPDLNFPQDIMLNDNAFQFFNQNIIPNIRRLRGG